MNIIKFVWSSLVTQYKQAIALFMIAPAIIALVSVPEFAQHVVEIHIGMFASRDAAASLQNDQARWIFGYVKILGLVLAILGSARFWWCYSSGGKWQNIFAVDWLKFFAGLACFILIGIVALPLQNYIPRVGFAIINIALSIASLPFIFMMSAGLFGDSSLRISHILKRSWPYLLLLGLLLFFGFAPWQWLHGMNHKWAFGSSPTVVWMLMIFDSLVVGLMASLVGSGIAVSYMAFRSSEAKG